jgi:hypothetical protein
LVNSHRKGSKTLDWYMTESTGPCFDVRPTSWRVRSIALLVLLTAPAYSDEISLRQLSGARIDADWFRYINSRFGVAVDTPARRYRYDVPVNGSGLTLTSFDRAVTITVYAHWLINILDSASNDVKRSIFLLFDKAVTDTTSKNGTVTYSVRRDDFYIISGNIGPNTYYERLIVSSECPAIFNSLRIFHPQTHERSRPPGYPNVVVFASYLFGRGGSSKI